MNNKGSESLFQASATCKLRLVRMLVEGGTSVNVRNERLETPLMLCCQSKTDPDEKLRVVTYLLGKKAKVNLQDIDERTALIHASLSNSGKEIIQTLLDAKSNPWIPDVSKNTVFDYVINAEDLETTRLLINACRESMLADERDNGQMEHLEACLANMQDLRKLSWPLMGPRIRKNHMLVYAAEKEEPSFPCNHLLGSDLGSNNQSKSPQPERRRKRSVCHFDPLDIQEILNCNEDTDNLDNKENKDESKSQSRKTSVRSLSEEEKFSFQISDEENSPRDPSSGLEKLLKLQDSFCSSLDSNEFPCTADDITQSPAMDQQISKETNFIQENEGVENCCEVENKKGQSETASSDSSDERQEVLNINTETKEKTKECGPLLIRRPPADSLNKEEKFKADSEREVGISSPTDTSKTGLESLKSRSNPYTSLVTSHQSAPLVSPLSSPQMLRRQTLMSVTSKQSTSPRASPVAISAEQNRRESSIVRRYTMSAMDMGKLRGAGVAKTLLAPPVQPTPVEPDKRRGSAVFESTARGDSEGNSTPPGLRKSKSDMTDWKSMSRNLQEKEFNESAPKQATGMQGAQPSSDSSKLEGSDISQFQLPSISSAKKGRRSPKEFIHSVSVATTGAENKQPNAEPKMELALLHLRNNAEKQRFSPQSGLEFSFDEQKCSPSSSLTTLSSSSSPKNLANISPSNSFDKSDVVAIATFTELSSRGLDKTSGDVLPDLLLNCPHQERDFLKQGGITSQNYNSRTFKDTITTNSNAPDERVVAGSSHGQQRISPRLRPSTLLPPLLISNRRSPTHEMEDGYFSCSPSPADVESPRRKFSNEQLRYSFKPISPRSPVPSSKAFALQSGKQPASR